MGGRHSAIGRVLAEGLAAGIVLLTSVGTAPAADAPAGKAGRWIVVTAPAFADAIAPLKKHREAEGFQVVEVKTTDVLSDAQITAHDGRPLLDKVRGLWAPDPANSYVLLVGAAAAATPDDQRKTTIPIFPGTIGRMKGQPTDDPYGCAPGDLLPKVAVGRWPARTPAEVKGMIDKTLAFEEDGKTAPWRRSITLLVGNPGGDSVAERALGNWYVGSAASENLARLDPLWNLRSIYHISTSPWYVPDAALHEQSLAFLRQGQTFSFYLGHASPDGFWSDGARFLDRADFAALNMPHGAGIFMTCGCYSCQLDALAREDHEGFGLAAMRNAGGPVAVIGATGESYAAAGELAFKGMLKGLSGPKLPERLGQSWLDVEAAIAAQPMGYLTFTMFDYGDGSAGKIPLAVQRQEHLEMWMLLGDPALQLPAVAPELTLGVPATITPGGVIKVTGTLPKEFEGAAVRLTAQRPAGSRPSDSQKAQDNLLAAVEIAGTGGNFEGSISLPAQLPWDQIVVRAVAKRNGREALGATRVKVEEK